MGGMMPDEITALDIGGIMPLTDMRERYTGRMYEA
jgi:hypothetical protein